VERDLLARERTAIAEAATEPERDASLGSALTAAEPWLLDGASAMAASGGLSRLLTALGLDAAILIQEVQTRPAADAAGMLEPVSVTVRALGDLEGLQRFLHAIENGELLLVIDELSLRPAGTNDGDLERGQLMSAGFVVTGFRLAEPATDPVMTASVELSR